MKNHKPKIAIVAGDLLVPRSLTLFESIKDEFEVVVYVLGDETTINQHNSSLRLQIIPEVEDMPGYMRGLEDALADADAIIGIEVSRLSSFQAVRAGRKFGVPVAVLAHEFLPYFYSEYPNIRAIQTDIIERADALWPTSQMASHCLTIEGADADKIRHVPVAVDVDRFTPNPKLRSKFRSYVQFEDEDFVILYQGPLEKNCRVEDILLAVSLLKQRRVPGVERMRILIAGQGSEAQTLKYRTADLGLGRDVSFLQQDCGPFLHDLYAASDAIVRPRISATDLHEDMPLNILEAMASGVVPVVSPGTIAHELVGGGGVVLGTEGNVVGDSYASLALALERLMGDYEVLRELSQRARSWVVDRHGLGNSKTPIAADLWKLLERHCGEERGFSIQALVQEVEHDLEQGRTQEAMVRVEEAILVDPPAVSARSMIHGLKGEIHEAQGDLESAMGSLTTAVRLDESNHRAYRSLGYLSLRSQCFEDALTFFRKALALDEGDAQTSLGIGLVYRKLGLLDEALFWLERAACSEGCPSVGLTALSQVCQETNRTGKALEVIDRVIEVIGEEPALLMAKGQIYLETGRSEQGHEILQRVLDAA